MMGAAPQHALSDAVSETLETMFFIPPPEACGASTRVGSGIEASISFSGELQGRLFLRVEPDTAMSIAADFLGQDQSETTHAQTVQVVCELANMICGSALSRMKPDGQFRLGAPSLEPSITGAHAAWERPYRAEVRTGDLRAGLICSE